MLDQMQSSLAGSEGALLLRVQTSGQENQDAKLVRIAASRCAIGSDDTCNLRVRGPSTRPMHCLILRGRDHVIVRRWSPDTLLNGQDFCDAIIVPGDRLKVGDAEFEVLDVNAGAAETVEGDVLEILDEPGATLQEVLLRRLQPDIHLRQARDTNRARARRLLGELRATRQRLTELKSRQVQPDPGFADVDDGDRPSPVVAEVTEIRFEPVPSEAPVSASALLGLQGVASLAPEQDEETEPTTATIRQTHDESERAKDAERDLPSAPKQGGESIGAEESEESIEFLFARLLERVGKPRDEVSYQATGAGPETDKPSNLPAKAAPTVEIEKPALLTELPARAARPAEHKTDLSALRELAQLNARSLLDLHFRRSVKRTTAGQAAITTLAFAAGVALMLLSTAAPVAFYPAIISFAVAIVWGAQYATSLWQMVQARVLKKAAGVDPTGGSAASNLTTERAPAATAVPEAVREIPPRPPVED